MFKNEENAFDAEKITDFKSEVNEKDLDINEALSEKTDDTLQGEKFFTQSQVDEIVKTRLARAMKNVPAKEEIDELRLQKKLNEENVLKIENLKKEADEASQRLLAYEQKEMINKRGVNAKFESFVRFETEKLTDDNTDFETALDEFISENPWVTESTPIKTGLCQGSKSAGISNLEESFYKRNPNLREI